MTRIASLLAALILTSTAVGCIVEDVGPGASPRPNVGHGSSTGLDPQPNASGALDPRPNASGALDPRPNGTPAEPQPSVSGDCPDLSSLRHAAGVPFQILAMAGSPFVPAQAGSIISDQAAWDAFLVNNPLKTTRPLPAWASLPYPNVAVLSLDKPLAGCGVRMRELSVTQRGQGIHIDWSLDLRRSLTSACEGVCGASLGAYAVIAFENKNTSALTQCQRIWPSCPVASSVNEAR